MRHQPVQDIWVKLKRRLTALEKEPLHYIPNLDAYGLFSNRMISPVSKGVDANITSHVKPV